MKNLRIPHFASRIICSCQPADRRRHVIALDLGQSRREHADDCRVIFLDEALDRFRQFLLAPHHHVLGKEPGRCQGDRLAEVLGQQHLPEKGTTLRPMDDRQCPLYPLERHGRTDGRRVLQWIDFEFGMRSAECGI